MAEAPDKTVEEIAALAALLNIAEDVEKEPKQRRLAAEAVLRHEWSRATIGTETV